MMSSFHAPLKFVFFLSGTTFVFTILLSIMRPTTFPFEATRNEKAPIRELIKDHSPVGFLFLKTHKTATETMLDILRKHRKRMNLTNEVTSYPKPYCGGYPGHFRSDLALINNGNKTSRVKGDVLMDHSRFNKKEMMSVMKSNVKYITILRNPFRVFESAFNFFYGRFHSAREAFTDATCLVQPYMQITGKLGVRFPSYIKLAENSLDDSKPWYFRSRNSQAHDLGLDPMSNDMDYILKQREEIDETFDLVLITEYLLESLVLLKNELQMTWEDVIPTRKNSGSYKHHEYTEEEKGIVRKLYNQDLILYDHFNKTLWNKIDQYGKERMKKDVAHLQNLIRNPKAGQNTKKKSSSVSKNAKQNRSISDNSGVISSNGNGVGVLMDNISKRRQRNQIVSTETTRKIAEHMIKNAGWCPK